MGEASPPWFRCSFCYKQALQYLHKGLSGIKVKWPPKVRTECWAVISCNHGLSVIQDRKLYICRLLPHPLFADTLQGWTNTMGTIPGFVAPQIVEYLTYDKVRFFIFLSITSDMQDNLQHVQHTTFILGRFHRSKRRFLFLNTF